jgi:GxxExxY protein
MTTTKSRLEHLSYLILGASIEVHKQLGPGLLESIYHECMKIELESRGLKFQSELLVPIHYNNRKLETNLKCDIFIENKIVVELKSVKQIDPIHEAQLLTYMKLLNAPKGILINFNCTNIFKKGQKTFVNEFFRELKE